MEPPVRLARGLQRRRQRQHALAPEALLAEIVLARRRAALHGARLFAVDLASRQQRPPTRAHEVGFPVPVDEQHHPRPAHEGSRVGADQPGDHSAVAGGAEVDVARLDANPDQALLRGEVGQVHGERLAVAAQQVVDEVALVAAAQRRKQAAVLLDQALPLLGEERHQHQQHHAHAAQEHDRERERDLAAQAQVGQRTQQPLHLSPSQPRGRARGPSGVGSTA